MGLLVARLELVRLGFNSIFVGWILACVSSVSRKNNFLGSKIATFISLGMPVLLHITHATKYVRAT